MNNDSERYDGWMEADIKKHLSTFIISSHFNSGLGYRYTFFKYQRSTWNKVPLKKKHFSTEIESEDDQ
jgi:hypothetical protein